MSMEDTRRNAGRKNAEMLLAEARTASEERRGVLLRDVFLGKLHDDDKLTVLINRWDDGTVSDSDLAEKNLILHVYQAVNNPVRNNPRIVDLLRAAKRANGDQPLVDQGRRMDKFPLPLYRGATADGGRLVSWSTKPSKAYEYAERCGGDVYTIEADRTMILGLTANQSENEYLCDPDLIPQPTLLDPDSLNA